MLLLAWLAACAPDAARPVSLATLDGRFTWTIDFDDAARASGHEPCSYTRVYSGEEDVSVPWLCPDCDITWRATVAMTPDDQACYAQISEVPPEPVEWLGLGDEQWWRGNENTLLAAVGPFEQDDDALTVSYDLEWKPLQADGSSTADAGSYQLSMTGDATLGTGRGDPWHGYRPPETYTCGWPDRDPPAFDGPWVLERGRLLPDGAFLDRCDEALRLHDLVGSWIVVDIAAKDCGPCQTMALDAPAFLETVDEPLIVVTLLTKSLVAQLEPTDRSDIDAWADAFDVSMPVVRDRGWGYWIGLASFGSAAAWPTTIVVGPDGRVRDMWVGYYGWERVRQVIDAG